MTDDELREAAAVRKQALGAKPYPVLVCSECFSLTGWLGSGGRCDVCISSARREDAFADPAGSWVGFGEPLTRAGSEAPSLFKRMFGSRRSREEALNAAWGERVDPGETGPATPEEGFVIYDADRNEWPAPEGGDLLVRFSVAAYGFERGGWTPTRRPGGPTPLTPHTFPASLPMDQLAEAWNDYCAEVHAFNAKLWSEEDQRREDEREEAQALAEAREEQTGTSDMLD
ncbi:MAG TPA: hypothetical protein VGI67_19590 [Thermoleophilaceae bacterium]|jgi:hypothetical protein